MLDISLLQTSPATAGVDLTTDGVTNFGFSIDLSSVDATVTSFVYATGFQADGLYGVALPLIAGESVTPTPISSASNTLLLGTAEITLSNAVTFGEVVTVSLTDFSGGANFRFDSGAHDNVDSVAFSANPIIDISAVPEPGSFVLLGVVLTVIGLITKRGIIRN